ncbi:UNVERIFIED_CONTAM: hypothetical protein GTU68_058897 [Idotea baltica]|nr:hypothetical protein [Idotea baltica]
MIGKTIALLLAGGVGSRLNPLTRDRAKPAVPFGGKYRIIDFTLSNCYHSGLRRVLVLTQYKSHSLQKHLRDGWSIFNPSLGEYITPVPPQMRTGDSWYVGTADAVYQNLYMLERSDADQVIILSGDHIYRMDYDAMLRFHCKNKADATVACMEVPIAEASAFGVMSVSDASRPVSAPNDPNQALVSMGIYVFSRKLLCEILKRDHENQDSSHDFGKDIINQLIKSHSVYGYRFGKETGRVTCDAYWRANIDLLKPIPPLDLYQRDWPIRSVESQGPPARTVPGAAGTPSEIKSTMMDTGSVISGGKVFNSILGRNVRIDDSAEVQNSILGNGVHIEAGARLNRCIIDKHVRVPSGESIGIDPSADAARFTISENGVVVVPTAYQFPSDNNVPDTEGPN